MSLVHYSLAIFVLLHGARLVAYWPQIVCVYRDPGCATAVSLSTWAVFTAANVATVIYAVGQLGDPIVAAAFGANTIGCAAIVALTIYKRYRHRSPHTSDGHSARLESLAIVTAAAEMQTRDLRATFKASRYRLSQRVAPLGLAAID